MASAFVVPWVALAEVVDLDRLVSGRRREGTFAGVMTFLRKLSTTFALMLMSISMDRTGYIAGNGDTGAEQPESVVLATRLCVSVVPSLALAGAIFFGLRYPMTRAAHKLVHRGLSAKDGVPLTPGEKEALSRLVRESW
jgi:Na+/melibiose symporter-like transporter